MCLRIMKFLSAALAGAALVAFDHRAEAANPRIALVIGESAYPDAALPTTANDAGLVAQVLQAAGFDVVGARDLDQKSVRESLRDFLDKANAAGPDMQAFVYFSGRALQYAGDNYLAPVDARIARDSDAPIEAIKISDFTHALAAAPGLARVVVDRRRAPQPLCAAGRSRSPAAWRWSIPSPTRVIAFNAAPGAIGVEDAGDYGVYAKIAGRPDAPGRRRHRRGSRPGPRRGEPEDAGRADPVERRQARRALFPVRARRRRAARRRSGASRPRSR